MKRRVHDSDMIHNEIIKTYHHYFKLHFFLIAENIWRVPYLGRISCAKLSGCRMQNAKPPLLHRTCLKKKTQIRREHVEQTASGVKSEAGEKPRRDQHEREPWGAEDQAGGLHQKFKSPRMAQKELLRTPNAPCLFFEHVGQFCDEHGYDMSSMALGKIVSHRNCDFRPSCGHLRNLSPPYDRAVFFFLTWQCSLYSFYLPQTYSSGQLQAFFLFCIFLFFGKTLDSWFFCFWKS
jgi:hypothetical protein